MLPAITTHVQIILLHCAVCCSVCWHYHIHATELPVAVWCSVLQCALDSPTYTLLSSLVRDMADACVYDMTHPHTWRVSFKRVTWLLHMSVMTHPWVYTQIPRGVSQGMSHITHMNEAPHTYEWLVLYTWMSHVTHKSEPCYSQSHVEWYFQSSFKAQSSKLERLFSLKRGKRKVWAFSFELWNRIRKCHPKWDWL